VTGIVIDARTCIDTLVLGPLTVSGLDVEALDESGRTLGRAPSLEQDKWMLVCSDEKRSFSLQLRPHEGSGTVLVLVSRGAQLAGSSRENQVDLGQTLTIEQVSAKVHEQLRLRHQPIGRSIARLTMTRGVQQRVEEPPEQGCSRYDVFAGAPSVDIQARAYSAGGDLVSSSLGGQHMPLLVCEKGTTTLVFDALTHGGPVLVEKSRIETPGLAITEYRRAASRLLARAQQLGLVLNTEELSGARSIAVGAKKPWDHAISTLAGHCTDVFASLDADALGIGISRIDGETSEPTDSEQDPHSAHLQLCCPTSSSDCRHHVRVTTKASGANALIATSTRS
jgi:hypothetical protein